VNGRHTPPTIVLRLLLEPPELLPPPLEGVESMEGVGVGVFVDDTVEEVEEETTDGCGGVASGFLPAIFASVGSNAPF